MLQVGRLVASSPVLGTVDRGKEKGVLDVWGSVDLGVIKCNDYVV